MSTTTETQTGTICRVIHDKAFCFIRPDNGGARDIFAHITGFADYVYPFSPSLMGRRVEFSVEETEKGPKAQNVRLVD